MQACVEVARSTDPGIELLWASTREAFNIVQADQIGCHIITAPLDVIKKVSGFNKPASADFGHRQDFQADAESAGFSLLRWPKPCFSHRRVPSRPRGSDNSATFTSQTAL